MSLGLTYRGVFKLDTAQDRFELPIPRSTYFKIFGATDIDTEINVAIQNDANGSNFIPMSRGADLQVAQGFDKLILSWSAQSGKQVEILCAAVEDNFRIRLPEKTDIDEIAQAVKVKNDPSNPELATKDADAETALNAILSMLQNGTDKRPPVNDLTGATVSVGAVGLNAIILPGANTNGLIIRHCTISASGATGILYKGTAAPAVWNDPTAPQVAAVLGGGVSLIKNPLLIPAGQGLWWGIQSVSCYATLHYEVL